MYINRKRIQQLFILIFCFYVFPSNANDYREGVDYTVLETPLSSGKGKVQEFFAYSCIHCYRVKDAMSNLEDNLPKGYSLSLNPVSFNIDKIKLLAKLFLIGQKLKVDKKTHHYIFELIHTPLPTEKNKFNQFRSIRDVKRFYVSIGVSRDDFEWALKEVEKENSVSRINNQAKAYGIKSTPSFVIDGKYLIRGAKQGLYSDEKLITKIMYLISLSKTNQKSK